MSNTIEFWRQRWDEATPSKTENVYGDPFKPEAINGGKIIELLTKYIDGFKNPLSGPIGGSLVRFFTGRWNTHHASAVESVLSHYSGLSGMYNESYQLTAPYVLALLKKYVGSDTINNEGDLYKILQVVKEKTKVDYFALDPESILNNAKKEAELERVANNLRADEKFNIKENAVKKNQRRSF